MPKIVDKEEMKNKIMDAAMIVYSDVGFHVATMDAIAKQSGVGKGTVYLYFKGKDALTVALVDRIFSRMAKGVTDAKPCSSLDEFRGQLRETLDISKEHAAFIRVFFEVLGPSFASDTFVKKVAAFFDDLGAHYAHQISHLQKAGVLRQDINPASTGRSLAAMMDGLILHKGLFSISTRKHREMIDASLELMFADPKA